MKKRLTKCIAVIAAISLTVGGWGTAGGGIVVTEVAAAEDVSATETASGSDSTTDEAVIYDASEISPFKDRTLQDVADRYSAARYAGETYINSDSSTWYSIPSSTTAPYAAGVLTEDTHEAMTAMTNFYRWLVGVPELTVTSQHSDSLQAQALDRNFEFAHSISNSSKPEDMDEDLWNEGFAVDHNILARFYTPQGAITGWINEGYSVSSQEWDTLGHRYALIGSTHSDIQFGYSGIIAIGKNVSSQNTMETPFAAFPAPGYMPTGLVSPSSSAWSVELNSSTITVEDSSAVLITVTDLSTGEVYQRMKADGTAQISSQRIYFVQPPASESRYSGEYSVEITGLTDAVTGKDAVIRYTTNFVDITEVAASYIDEVAGDISRYIIYQSMADSLDKVAAILPDEITVTSEIGGTATIPVAGAWTVDESNSCFVNSADANLLPSNMTDKNGLLEKIIIPYTISEDWYDSFNSLSISPDTVSAGDTVTFRVYRTLISTDTSQIFKLTENADGTYSAVKKFDSSTSADFNKEQSDENSPYHIYNHTAAAEDSGEYISVYFDSGDVDWGGISFYVSTGTKILTVASHAHVYGTPEFTWSDDYTSCTAIFTCEDGDDSQEVGCVVTSVDNSDGTVTYTATAEFDGTSFEDTRTTGQAGESPEDPSGSGDDTTGEGSGDDGSSSVTPDDDVDTENPADEGGSSGDDITGEDSADDGTSSGDGTSGEGSGDGGSSSDDATGGDVADGGTSSVTPGDDTDSGSSGADDNTADVPDDNTSADGTSDADGSTSTDDDASGSSPDTTDDGSSQASGSDEDGQASESSSSTSSGDSAQTGDNSNVVVWFMLLAAGGAAAVTGISRKRKQY